MTTAAIYARVSSARQAKDETIGSQLAAVLAHAEQQGLDVPPGRVFTDDGYSGASLIRPGLERLRDLIAQVPIDVLVCYAPDRLARKFAYQALLIEEFTRAGTRVEFVKGPRGDSPEDQLLVQFQGMFAEYEKAQILERSRRGKAHRAKAGSVNVLGGAPFGYRYVRKTPDSGAVYEICEHEAVLVAELFRRYTDDGASIADLARWLSDQGAPTRTGKHRWDRSVIWGMLRNPAYAGTAMFGKTTSVPQPAGLNRVARLAGRSTPTGHKTIDRPREEWTAIPVPAIISEQTFARAEQRLADNKRFAARNSKVPSLLQGLTACAGCGYAYYRTSTRTTNKKIFYYRCLGSDDYRYPGGRICTNTPVRADHLDQLVWDHITTLISDPALIQAEIDKRLAAARTSDPTVAEHTRLRTALAKTTSTIAQMITAFSEQLLTIDELRTRMPDLRARETNLCNQIQAIDAQAADRGAYLKLAQDLTGFLNQLQHAADTAAVPERQRILRLLVKDVLVGPDTITIRHRIPIRERTHEPAEPDTESDPAPDCPLRWGRHDPDPRELDRLMATGEAAAASLLALALDALDVPARSFSGSAAGIATTEHHGRARILSVDPRPLRAAVEAGWVPVVTGFQGGRADGELTTLGRGGSDTSAIAIAAAHGLPCEIYTDVAGVQAADPRLEPAAKHRPFVTHAVMADMSAHGSGVVARRAIELAEAYDVPLQVRSSLTWRPGTVVGHGAAPLEAPSVIAVSADQSAVAVRIEGSIADPAGMADVLDELGRAEVPVIMIPGVAADPRAVIAVLVSGSDLPAAVGVLGGIARHRGGRVTWDAGQALVAVTGIGLTAHPGIIATIARAVGRVSPRARLLTAAPSSTSWLVPADDTSEVVRALCADLELRSEHPHHAPDPDRDGPAPLPDCPAEHAFAAG